MPIRSLSRFVTPALCVLAGLPAHAGWDAKGCLVTNASGRTVTLLLVGFLGGSEGRAGLVDPAAAGPRQVRPFEVPEGEGAWAAPALASIVLPPWSSRERVLDRTGDGPAAALLRAVEKDPPAGEAQLFPAMLMIRVVLDGEGRCLVATPSKRLATATLPDGRVRFNLTFQDGGTWSARDVGVPDLTTLFRGPGVGLSTLDPSPSAPGDGKVSGGASSKPAAAREERKGPATAGGMAASGRPGSCDTRSGPAGAGSKPAVRAPWEGVRGCRVTGIASKAVALSLLNFRNACGRVALAEPGGAGAPVAPRLTRREQAARAQWERREQKRSAREAKDNRVRDQARREAAVAAVLGDPPGAGAPAAAVPEPPPACPLPAFLPPGQAGVPGGPSFGAGAADPLAPCPIESFGCPPGGAPLQ